MNKTIQFILILAIVVMTGTACKSKQKVAKITGANIPAASTTTATSTNPTASSQDLNNQSEITRNEKFILADGETNAEALKFKYHVVVGSFKSQSNAKGLQATLKSEGNKAIVVVNEQDMFRVLIASYNGYSEARAKINQIKDRFADSWVLVQK